MGNIILDMSGAYDTDWCRGLCENDGFSYIDCKDIEGTDMYCDDLAITEIMGRIRGNETEPECKIYSGVHFIDSGNYHYMTRLFTGEIKASYNLFFFDHHTDMKPSMIPELLSCGAWALHVAERDSFIKKIIMIGPPAEDVTEDILTWESIIYSGGKYAGSDEFVSDILKGGIDFALPYYISIDKDVLGRGYADTNWSQGDMELGELFSLMEAIKKLCGGAPLGIDICGELPGKGSSVNESTNNKILDFLKSTGLF
ncbi:MAG: hypothetical protein IJ608_11150 [Lachnospiraceae bacterium]|nr:hypothetical protein [Lachnospiraceae bacterium]